MDGPTPRAGEPQDAADGADRSSSAVLTVVLAVVAVVAVVLVVLSMTGQETAAEDEPEQASQAVPREREEREPARQPGEPPEGFDPDNLPEPEGEFVPPVGGDYHTLYEFVEAGDVTDPAELFAMNFVEVFLSNHWEQPGSEVFEEMAEYVTPEHAEELRAEEESRWEVEDTIRRNRRQVSVAEVLHIERLGPSGDGRALGVGVRLTTTTTDGEMSILYTVRVDVVDDGDGGYVIADYQVL